MAGSLCCWQMGTSEFLQSRTYQDRENSSEPLEPFTVEPSASPSYKFTLRWPSNGNPCLILPNPQARALATRARVAISK
jgi:hypothetical protein